MQKNDFEDYEKRYKSSTEMKEDEGRIQEKKDELYAISKSLSTIWNLTEIQSVWNKRFECCKSRGSRFL